MRVAFLSYPMLFQTVGGLQVQMLETIEALRRKGVHAELLGGTREQLHDFDLVHVFAAINGVERIVQHAKAIRVPVVTSPLIQPHWNASRGRTARWLSSLVGRLTSWEVRTDYQQIESCLQNSDHIIALGSAERESIATAFRVPRSRISVIPNGVPERFFQATPNAVADSRGLRPGFILNVAAINSYKNQLTLTSAFVNVATPIVLAGEVLPHCADYLGECMRFPNVHYLGKLRYDDPVLTSAYAAAAVFCLPSQSEVMPLTILESLAAGTPVVCTRHHSMDLAGFDDVLIQVDPNDTSAIRSAVEKFLRNPPTRAQCQAAVRHLTWDAVAVALQHCYSKVLSERSKK